MFAARLAGFPATYWRIMARLRCCCSSVGMLAFDTTWSLLQPFSSCSDAGGASDHLATIKAFNQWKGAQSVGRRVCREQSTVGQGVSQFSGS